MISRLPLVLALIGAVLAPHIEAKPHPFVSAKDHRFYLNDQPYYFVGANYWYGGLLGLEKDKNRGVGRLRRELDFLKANGVTNLRLMAGAEGTGLMNGVTRVGPSLQPEPGKFDEKVLDGLDLVLYEMGKRKMNAVIFLSNNWEWSGGFQQYLIWNGMISDEWLARKPSWDEVRENVSKFYFCQPCMDGYRKQAAFVIGPEGAAEHASLLLVRLLDVLETPRRPQRLRHRPASTTSGGARPSSRRRCRGFAARRRTGCRTACASRGSRNRSGRSRARLPS